MRRTVVSLVLFVAGALALAAPPAGTGPRYVDDDEFYEHVFNKLEDLAKAKKPLAHKKLVAKRKPGPANVALAKPGEKALAPEDVYKLAEKSVFVVASTFPDKDGNWESGTYASAWAVTADGALVTNWHVFEDLKDGEVFGAADRDGTVYPVTDFLGGDKTADVAVFRIAAKNLAPLPVAPAHAEVGSWVGVISHPGDLFYVYTQGTVTRYSTNKNPDDEKKREKWMGITAEFASGSSGSPVLNKYGAVVGMAAQTLSLEASDEAAANPARRLRPKFARLQDDKKDDKKGDKKGDDKAKEVPKGSPQQMVVKMAVPGTELLRVLGK